MKIVFIMQLVMAVVLYACQSSDKTSAISQLRASEAKTVQQNSELLESIKRGETIYSDFCINCHLPNGKGVPKAFPPLAQSDYLMTKREASIKAIKYGQTGEITVNGSLYNSVMAPLGLEDQEVADVMNYISNSWGNSNDVMVTKKEVSEIEP